MKISALPFVLALIAPVSAQLAPGKEGRSYCVFPPNREPVTVTLAGGREARLDLRRAGTTVWYETADGYPVLPRGDRWAFARLDAAGDLRATEAMLGDANPEAAGVLPNVRPLANPLQGAGGPAHAIPTTGTAKNLVICLRFSDHGPTGQNRTLPPQGDLEVLWNKIGGDPTLAPTGSVADAWLENSYGVFTFDSTVVAWFDVPNTEAHYANGNYGLSSVTWDLVRDGLNAVDAVVPWLELDQDGDGFVDVLTVLHSGYGAEFGGVDQYGTAAIDRIWSHRWAISPPWVSSKGVQVADYSISPGLWGESGSDPVRIGVLTHELGHILGLPDLYDTAGGSYGAGDWELMSTGAWAVDNQQYLPSHLSAWSKWKLGWLEPRMLDQGWNIFESVELNPEAGLISCGYGVGEYLLLENRNKVGLDSILPGEGLLVWHVDEAKGSLPYNTPNTDEGYPGMPALPLWPSNGSHYRLALLQPDDKWDLERWVSAGDAGDIWPGPASSPSRGARPRAPLATRKGS